jgi:hypothetical protein
VATCRLNGEKMKDQEAVQPILTNRTYSCFASGGPLCWRDGSNQPLSSSTWAIAALSVVLCFALLGCGPRLDSPDWQVRLNAVDRIKDSEVLVRVAIGDDNSAVRQYALRKITDQSLLTRVATNTHHFDVGRQAVERLRDPALVAQVANEAKDWDVRLEAVRQIPGQTELADLMFQGSNRSWERDVSGDAKRCIARMQLATREPLVKSHFPRLRCESTISITKQEYGRLGYSGPSCFQSGEDVNVKLTQDGKTLAESSWNNSFANSVGEHVGTDGHCSPPFVPAGVWGGDLMIKLFQGGAFTQTELTELLHSYIPEVRAGAAWLITDQALLVQALIEDGEIERTAVDRITDQAVLADVVIKADGDRELALEKIKREDLLTKVANEAKSSQMRRDAAERLSRSSR